MMGIAEALAGLNVGLKAVDGLSKLGVTAASAFDDSVGTDPGRVYCKVRNLMEKRHILGTANKLKTADDKYVMSPALSAFRGLFGPDEYASGVVYVLHDEPGNGKSTAGEALLNEFYDIDHESGRQIKGFMLKGDALGDNLVLSIMAELDCEKVKGWIHVLLHALDEPDEDEPSILILDGVNSLGEENINKNFVKALCDSMGAKMNIFIVVICQDRDVATELCGLNKGRRVVPMPGFYSGDILITPEWKKTRWNRDLLIQMIDLKYEDKVTEEMLAFVEDGMTPCEVLLKICPKLRTRKVAPQSPKKRKHVEEG